MEKELEPLPKTGVDAKTRQAPEGLRAMQVGETIHRGDMVWPNGCDELTTTVAYDSEIEEEDVGFYFTARPLPPAGLPAAPRDPGSVTEALRAALDKIEGQAVCGAIAKDMDEACWMLSQIAMMAAALSSVAEGPVRSAEPESNPSNSEVTP